jgi:hypothetical protein
LTFPSIENGRGDGRRRYGRRLELGATRLGRRPLGLGGVTERRRHLSTWEAQLQGYERGIDGFWHRDIDVASRQRQGRQRSEIRGGVSRVMRHMEAHW